MRRKIPRSELEKFQKLNPQTAIFECWQSNPHQMVFYCPYCVKYHNHGIDAEHFRISLRIAHCMGNKNSPMRGYAVFWNGKPLPKK